ncbi:MAG: O-methyltransferase [Paludibacteraceae bacterium]|nr:O-methyltransferase [Paludibacteraceae bacterium]
MTLNEYIEQHSSLESELLQTINHDTNLHVLNAHMLSGQVQGRLLALLSKMIQPKRIVELGTFTGYSALCLAEGLTSDGQLITIEHNDELEDMIRHNFHASAYEQQISLMIGDCKELIPTLPNDIDLVFMDADKREYCTYLDLIYTHVRAGGWVLADNTLWDRHVIDPAYDKDAQTLGLRAFNDQVAQDERFEKVILPIRDGLTIMRKIG